MALHGVTGTRIRERRIDKGLKQADVAESVGISASYLNLIEHNKRRIGGRLLDHLAELLEVDAAALSSGADTVTLDGMRAAAARHRLMTEVDRAEDFAARYPGWAGLVATQEVRIAALEAEVQTLSDRMAHDPALADALHNVITAVTSIRATAGILVNEERVDEDWQSRFHVNIHDDSQKLADESQALVAYLDRPKLDSSQHAPQSVFDQIDTFLHEHPELFDAIERNPNASIADLLSDEALQQLDQDARFVLTQRVTQFSRDASCLPMPQFLAAVRDIGLDPAELALTFDVELTTVFRRLAYLPANLGFPPMGLVVCDAAGALLEIKTIPGFGLHRRATSCPLWPLYQALVDPHRPYKSEVVLADPAETRFQCYAIAESQTARSFDTSRRVLSTMLVVGDAPPTQATPIPVGTSCRVCPRHDCRSRREPSVIATSPSGSSQE